MQNVEKKFYLLAPQSSIIKLEEANKDVMDWLREMNKTDNRLRQGGADNNEIFSTGKENSN